MEDYEVVTDALKLAEAQNQRLLYLAVLAIAVLAVIVLLLYMPRTEKIIVLTCEKRKYDLRASRQAKARARAEEEVVELKKQLEEERLARETVARLHEQEKQETAEAAERRLQRVKQHTEARAQKYAEIADTWRNLLSNRTDATYSQAMAAEERLRKEIRVLERAEEGI